ncbi:cupin domain-containing protein [Micromonospora sp. WMMD1120]|uniref:cupin domain-containing protein n=1 Tax=Micromonospora sp. WMMD1120 TaxID=3016106 RepID=UPI002416FB81|nr:cupin domain-containing protein [Micromonospora sp. WMMD1120]MDG4810780.1 cupin domain-containing protein [Micromonospora sp. WMMD1120]
MNVLTRTGGDTRLDGRHGSVEVTDLAPGQALPAGAADTETGVFLLSGTLSDLDPGAALFLPVGEPGDLVAGPEGARVLLVRARGAQRPPAVARRPPEVDHVSSAVLAAGGGFTDMRVRWLVCRADAGSTRLVVATSTFAPDGHHELHRHPNAEEFFMVLDGGGEHLTETGAIRLGPGDVVLVAAGEWHGYRTDPEVTTTTVYGYLGAASLDEAGYEVRA